jgi:hypothetical protein
LLKATGLARSTFYYRQKSLQVADQYAELKAKIGVLFETQQARYGYRRMTSTLRQMGHPIHHKTVQGLMRPLPLNSLVRVKKYRAYIVVYIVLNSSM